MNRFWKKRLPAILLAMVMVLGMVPAAMAADCGHNNWGGWQKLDDTKHQRKCLSSDCAGTQEANHNWGTAYATDGNNHWKKCADCGAETAKEAHSYSGTMKTDANYHWDQCTVCGYKDNLGGHVDLNGDAKCDTCGYSMSGLYVTVTFKNGGSTFKTQTNVVKGTAPANPGTPTYPGSGSYDFVGWVTSNPGSTAAYTGQTYYTSSQVAARTVSAATTYYAVYKVPTSQSITYTVAPGEKDTIDAEDFNDAYQDAKDTTSSIRWVEFYAPRSYTSFEGTLYYDYGGSDEQALSRSDLNDNSFYFSSSDYGEFDLDELTFVADKDADEDSVTITFTAYRSSSSYVEGELVLEIDEDGGSGTTIVYEVDTDDSVDFKKSDFNKVFQEEYPNYTMRWVEFTTSDTLSASSGTVYYDYDGSDEEAFSKSTIDDYQFYYTDSGYGEYALSGLSFVSGSSKRTVTLEFRAYYSSSRYVDGTVEIRVGGSSGSKGDITYKLDPGEEVEFSRTDFNKFFQQEADSTSTIKYVTFSTTDTLSTSSGTVYYDYGGSDEKAFTKSTIDDYKFYYSSDADGDYALKDLSFAAPKSAAKRTVEIEFTAYYSSTKKASGTLVIELGGTSSASKTAITYEVEAGGQVEFDRKDFNKFFQEETNSTGNLKYVTFDTDDVLSKSLSGLLYYDYDGADEESFNEDDLSGCKFYYSASDGDYDLSSLSFVAGKSFKKAITLNFTAYYSSTKKASGTLVIKPKEATSVINLMLGDIVYNTTTNTSVQIKASDIERFFKSKYPTGKLQSVVLGGAPAAGSLYYNYYSASPYGASRLLLTAANCKQNTLYASPTAASQYALTELLYIPSGTNYCTAIPFTATGTAAQSASGVILISVTSKAVGEVYGITPKGTDVAFPASAISGAVAAATGTAPASIQLLKLPAANVGTVCFGSGTAAKANILTQYGFSGSQQVSQLHFVPAAGYTGSVELPYVALNSSGKAIAAGKFSLGVLGTRKNFSDVTASTWCYKYVAELSDAKVIDGYPDGSFKPDNKISYGAALKLVMLAAGYPEQKPTDSNAFSGYLAKAREEGIITRSNVNLSAPITRLQVAQLAAGAMKLDTSKVSSVKPFTDTDNASVQALNEAGIVEGYFSGGISTYKPNNTLTRGQVSAIVWRMQNYQK